MENSEQVTYPILENKERKWTAEYKKQYNREYRQKVKSGEIKPNKRTNDSKWDNREYRKKYEEARKTKLAEQDYEKKMSLEPITSRHTGKRPNYTQKEKDEILKKMLEVIKKGESIDHPYLMLTLDYKPEQKRDYHFKNQESSTKN